MPCKVMCTCTVQPGNVPRGPEEAVAVHGGDELLVGVSLAVARGGGLAFIAISHPRNLGTEGAGSRVQGWLPSRLTACSTPSLATARPLPQSFRDCIALLFGERCSVEKWLSESLVVARSGQARPKTFGKT